MNKKLPKLYVNKIDKIIDNNDLVFYSAKKFKVKEEKTTSSTSKNDIQSIEEKIQALFNSPNFVYKKNATITLKDKEVINKDIIGQKDNKLITIDDETINVADIKDIKF